MISFFSIPSPSGGDVSAKVRKFFIPASDPKKFYFLRPARPDLCQSTSGAYPSRLCECKGTTFLIPRKPCPDNSSKKSHTALTVRPKEIHSSTKQPYPRQEQETPLPSDLALLPVIDFPQSRDTPTP